MFSRNYILVRTIIAVMTGSLVNGFGINIMIVPEDDPSQVICTLALLSKYFRSGESLSGSVLSISLTSASINVQQNVLRAIHTDRTHPWTVVLNYARTMKPTLSASMALHEKPQCYFVILENLENYDLDDIFENWKLTINWNPMAQFVVYLASVEETDEEMTELMIEILLNYLNKKIYNINVIGQNDENGFFYGKTVFPYHPDNNCGNRVIAIETLDLCDYQEAEQEHNDEEEEYVYDVRDDGNGYGGRNVIKEQGEEEVKEGDVLNEVEEEVGNDKGVGGNVEVGEKVIGVKGEKDEIGKREVGEDDVGNEKGGEDVDEENIVEKEEEEIVIERGEGEEEIGEDEVEKGIVAAREEEEAIIGEVDVGEKNTGEKKVVEDIIGVGEKKVGREFVAVTKEGETIIKKDEMGEEYIREEGVEEEHTELEEGWKKVGEQKIREGGAGVTDDGETIIGEDEVKKDITEHGVGAEELGKDVVGSSEEGDTIKEEKDVGEENNAEKKGEIEGAEKEVVEGVDGVAKEREKIIGEEELDAEKVWKKEDEKVVYMQEEGIEVKREDELGKQKGTKGTLMKDEVADEDKDDLKTGFEDIGYGVEEKANVRDNKVLKEGTKGEEEVDQQDKEEDKKGNKEISMKEESEEGENKTRSNVNMEHQVISKRKVEVNRKVEEKEVIEKTIIEKKGNREKLEVDESLTMKKKVRREVHKKMTIENDKTAKVNEETAIKEESTETSYWNNIYTTVENTQVQENLNKTLTENYTKNYNENHHLRKNSVGKKNKNNNHRRIEKLSNESIKSKKRLKNFHKSAIRKHYPHNIRKGMRRTRQTDMDFDDDDMDTKHSSKDDEAALQGTMYMEEHFRALFLDKFPRDLSGCTLVAAFRSWEPYIFALEKAKEKKHEYPNGDTTGEGIRNGFETSDEFENGPSRDIFGEVGDVAGGVDVFGDTAIFEKSDVDGDGEGGGDGPGVAGNSDDFEPDTSQIEGDLKLSGIEYKIVQTIAERLHIHIDIQVENNNLYQLFQQLMDGDIEMVVGGIDEDPSISQFVSSTIPYHQDDLTWCVAKAKHQLNFFNFLATFRADTWLLTQACVLLLSLTVFYTQRALKMQLAQLQGYSSICLRLFGVIITTQSMRLKSMPSALKIALGSAFFMSLMFSNIYHSFLVSTLTTPKSMFQISHITEIYNHRMAIMGSVDNVRHMNKDGEIFKYIREKFEMCYNIEECLRRAAIDDRVAVAVSRMHTFYNPRIPRDLLYCFDRDENLYAYLVTMLLPKKFHLLHMINPVIQHVIESGHIQKWSRDLDNKRQIEQETHQVREAIVRSLNLAEVGGCFAFTGFLLLIALVLFMVECCVHRMVTQQKTRLILVKILHRQFS